MFAIRERGYDISREMAEIGGMRPGYRNQQKKSVLFKAPGLFIGALAFGSRRRERLAGLMERLRRLGTIVQNQGQCQHRHRRAHLPCAGAATLRRDEDQPQVWRAVVLLGI
ncbi:UNVERIFIED_ORG: hypothetical protein M2435_006546 [Rhizobium sophorae]|nr:hypothetical protein [Rhizobium leguminosarum]MDH6663600.1 hypothetical protein [Rhizobium sophorae]